MLTTRTSLVTALVISALAIGLTAGPVHGQTTGTITVEKSFQTDAQNGGEFYVTGFTGISIAAPGTDVQDTRPNPDSLFQVFCVETDEFLEFGLTFDIETNSNAVEGGSGGPEPDPLGDHTAYLFDEFWEGVLSSYQYIHDTGAEIDARDDDADSLQFAIWYLEDEKSFEDIEDAMGVGTAKTLQAKAWINEAIEASEFEVDFKYVDPPVLGDPTDGAVTSFGSAGGTGQIVVLNLYKLGDLQLEDPTLRTFHQDLLVKIEDNGAAEPIPVPAAAWMGLSTLAALGLFGGMRRRVRN